MFDSLKRIFGRKPKEAEAPVNLEEAVGDSGKKIAEDELDELLWNVELGLLEADVALPVIEEIKAQVKADLLGKRFDKKYQARGRGPFGVEGRCVEDPGGKRLRLR